MEDIRSARKKSVPQSVKLNEDELDMVSGGGGEYYGGPEPEIVVVCPNNGGEHAWIYDNSVLAFRCFFCGALRYS